MSSMQREKTTEQLRPVQSRSNLLKPWSGERGSPQQSCDTAVEVSSGAISVAVAEHCLGESLACSESPDLAVQASHHDLPGAASQGASQQATGSVRVWDLTSLQQWSSICKQLDASLAIALESSEEVTQTDFKVREGATGEDMGGLYVRTEPETASVKLKEALKLSSNWLALGGTGLEGIKSCAEKGGRAHEPLNSWSTRPLPTQPESQASQLAAVVTRSLERTAVSDLLPATRSQLSANWLAYSQQGIAASGLALQAGGPLWISGFSKSPAALQPVFLSLPIGPQTQAVLREHKGEGLASRRHWVIQQDENALVAAELVLRSWRAEASCQSAGATAHCWEESDSAAVVFGANNALGTAVEVEQQPGQLLALHRQGHCSWAEGGFYLSWNVAIGPSWPLHATREGRIRSSAIRTAAAAQKNPMLGSGLSKPPTLHVLRLLFAAACSIPQVHETVLEGLREHFLPLCEAELRVQEETELPQLNMPKGTLDSDDPKSLRCSCCMGEFLFSCVRLIKRKAEEREGMFCWQCWREQRRIGLVDADGPPRNARNCTAVGSQDVRRLIALIETARPCKRARLS